MNPETMLMEINTPAEREKRQRMKRALVEALRRDPKSKTVFGSYSSVQTYSN